MSAKNQKEVRRAIRKAKATIKEGFKKKIKVHDSLLGVLVHAWGKHSDSVCPLRLTHAYKQGKRKMKGLPGS